MAIDVKTISMMDLRSTPGEILDKVAVEGEAFIIERKGDLLACLVPVNLFFPNIKKDVINRELEILDTNNERPKIRLSDAKELELNFIETTYYEGYTIKIVLPHGFPNIPPRIYVSPVEADTPHRWEDGSVCIYGAYSTWNPGKHNIMHALKLSKTWLKHYVNWKKNGQWGEIKNEE